MSSETQVNTPNTRTSRRTEPSDDRRARRRELRPKYISVLEACDYIGVSRAFFYDKIAPKVRIVKIGRRALVDLDSLGELGE